ncbi:hypothetical protein [Flavobacterium caeni]|uniref:Uncharacterized protein n=1 Tax=Flavobacterium caeni TaxID=490189 RepID=A0A1G5JGM2_9FLAO|nr:hypothetical protein [Flavobacterium caeni]SCY87314.1 hypothetical protein SAMN02927903_02688 [Flavobacterium caeni]
MKKLSLLLVALASVTVYGKEVVPGPTIWYTISEKILKGSHQLIVSDAEAAKAKKTRAAGERSEAKTPKTKVLKVSTKFQQKDELVLPDFMTPTVTKNVWFLPE